MRATESRRVSGAARRGTRTWRGRTRRLVIGTGGHAAFPYGSPPPVRVANTHDRGPVRPVRRRAPDEVRDFAAPGGANSPPASASGGWCCCPPGAGPSWVRSASPPSRRCVPPLWSGRSCAAREAFLDLEDLAEVAAALTRDGHTGRTYVLCTGPARAPVPPRPGPAALHSVVGCGLLDGDGGRPLVRVTPPKLWRDAVCPGASRSTYGCAAARRAPLQERMRDRGSTAESHELQCLE